MSRCWKYLFCVMNITVFLQSSMFAVAGSGDDSPIVHRDNNDEQFEKAFQQERKRLIDNDFNGMKENEKEAAIKEFDRMYAKGRFNDLLLKNGSVLYPRMPLWMQSSSVIKKLVLPSEGALIFAFISTVPRLFTTIFCDGILQEGAQRLYKRLHNMVYASPLILTSDIPDNLTIDDLVLHRDVHRQLLVNINSFSNIAKNKGRAQFNGLLFYGPPGTGKTEAARVMASMIAEKNDIFYHELSGDVLAGASREELRDLIDSLRGYRKPTIVLIDECEKFLLDRRLGLRKGESIPEGLSEWLNFTSKPSKNILFIYTTNYIEKIEKAMKRRVQPVEFSLPDAEARMQILYNFFNKYFLFDPIYTETEHHLMQGVFTPEYFKRIANQLVYKRKDSNGRIVEEDRFSPANIENIVNDVKNFSIANNERGVPTKEFFEHVVGRALQVKKEEIETEERLFGKYAMIGTVVAKSSAAPAD